MTPAEFQNQLLEKLCLSPSFDVEEVESIECSGGATWINLKNGDLYCVKLELMPQPVDDLANLNVFTNSK